MAVDDPVWNHSTFSQKQERLLRSEIGAKFLSRILEQAREAGLLSDEHFTVDGTLVESWASLKSFRPKDGPPPPAAKGRNDEVDYKGQKRKNDTHVSTTDPPKYRISQKVRKRVEEVFGWMKTVGVFRKTRYIGTEKVGWHFALTAAAYNLVRMRKLPSTAWRGDGVVKVRVY